MSPRIAILVLGILGAAAGPARAGDPVVVAVDKAEVYVDLGGKDGVGAGAVLELLHEVDVRDPVTGEALRDRFAIGLLEVVRAGDGVCVASAPAELLPRIRPGDAVALASERKVLRDAWQARLEARQGAAERELPSNDPRARARAERLVADADLARAVWLATLGKEPAARIEQWRSHLAARPDSAYAAAIQQEIASLTAQVGAADAASRERAALGRRDDLRARRLAAVDASVRQGGPLFGRPPERVVEGADLVLAFGMRDPAEVTGAWLYVRTGGEDRYRKIAMARSGDAYLRARVPRDAVRPPAVEYVVEVAGQDGEPHAVVGQDARPERVAVDPAVEDPPPVITGRSRVTLTGEYVDFDGGRSAGFDEYYQVEADFMYRFIRPVYALRLGFGTLSGEGGPTDAIDDDLDGNGLDDCRNPAGRFVCRRLTYSYIYAELEHRFSDVVAVMLRPIAGQLTTDLRQGGPTDRCVGADTDECAYQTGLGLRARLRIGDETKTNIALGVGVTSNVGTLFEAAYAWNAYPALPVTIAVQVTDQPVTTDFGVRLVGDVGYRRMGWLYPSLRLSYQARDVDHAGFSGGAGVNFDW